MEKEIVYMSEKVKVRCDEQCNKAWGVGSRPSLQLSKDDDDSVWLTDKELPEAPIDPGTYEGGQAKPVNKKGIPNKWCIRECERCAMSFPGKIDQPLKIRDFTKRIYNQPWKHTSALNKKIIESIDHTNIYKINLQPFPKFITKRENDSHFKGT